MEKLALDLLREAATLGGFGWVVAVLLIIALVIRDRQYLECQRAQIELAKSVTVLLERATAANVTVAAALESRTGVFERMVERTSALIAEIDGVSGRVERIGREIGDARKEINELRIEASRGGRSS